MLWLKMVYKNFEDSLDQKIFFEDLKLAISHALHIIYQNFKCKYTEMSLQRKQ